MRFIDRIEYGLQVKQKTPGKVHGAGLGDVMKIMKEKNIDQEF